MIKPLIMRECSAAAMATTEFTAKTGIDVEWVTLEENVLRERVTTDITTKGVANAKFRHIAFVKMFGSPIRSIGAGFHGIEVICKQALPARAKSRASNSSPSEKLVE